MRPKIIIVYKTGGAYDTEDVANIKQQIKDNTTLPHEIVCYSDDDSVADVKLKNDLPGFWSKVEIFAETGPCVYFDMDVCILANIDKLLEQALNTTGIYMLEPSSQVVENINDMSSSIMCWCGDYSYLINELKHSDYGYRGDQTYIVQKLRSKNVDILDLTNIVPIYGWSTRCVYGVPDDTAIINFFDLPRPRDIGLPYWGRHLV